jgi:long-subunit fatty acid transport protein
MIGQARGGDLPRGRESNKGKTMKSIVHLSVLAAAVSFALASNPARAITNIEANAGPQFNFVNPGARSLGMAGAFLGLADDSTAAYTNPAGLGQLSRREWAIEGRYTDFSTLSVRRGRLVSPPTGIGLDTIDGLQTQETDRHVANLSFLSFAFPLKNGTLAVYRHELANYRGSFTSEGPFTNTFNQDVTPPGVGRIAPSHNDVDLQIVNYGFAGSWRATPHLMLGGSLNWYQFDFDTTTLRYNMDLDGDGAISREERLTALDLDPDNLRGIGTQKGNDGDFSFTLGLLWQPNDTWSVGAVYRRGPDFSYRYKSVNFFDARPPTEGTTDFVVPDVFGVGVAYRPSESWRVALDLARVTYSDHVQHVRAMSFDTDIDYLNLNDATEVRLGAEYTDADAKHPFSLRFGAWHEPDHQMYFDGEIFQYTGTPFTELQNEQNSHAAMFVRASDSWHLTGGYGIVFDKFQIDTAVDLSNRADVFSVSMVYFLN